VAVAWSALALPPDEAHQHRGDSTHEGLELIGSGGIEGFWP
jgi:hypothetical protein